MTSTLKCGFIVGTLISAGIFLERSGLLFRADEFLWRKYGVKMPPRPIVYPVNAHENPPAENAS